MAKQHRLKIDHRLLLAAIASALFLILIISSKNTTFKGETLQGYTVTPVAVYSGIRVFNIKAEQNKFTPAKINVYQNDIVKIQFNAVDNPYDLSFPGLNLSISVKTGDIKPLEFQAVSVGSFTFTCTSCLNPKPEGTLTVMEK